ncbi:flagellar hook-basal body complex protein FliE [Sphingomonas sp. LaA6.9]|uniref:flagellar hook-basal body complex protein FliE n=1 Tax=Sphingomonas sp. LaA6.9 TaxID=2919914 RepID=UPI001F4F64B8|nr:flagellar hook-basal body complex protein FliE [Sphingomonas sp. LaA6.9]MCJ8156347.1 flagellar hook-basal body complex protein FliE [Sphingomonas sp. LaA6.9]
MTKVDAASVLAMRNAIIQQNASLQKAAGVAPGGAAGKSDFAGALKGALNEVNELQSKSSAATDAYERGDTADIASVMLAREKASLGFQATLQVRNKLLSAYKDIMSMPV